MRPSTLTAMLTMTPREIDAFMVPARSPRVLSPRHPAGFARRGPRLGATRSCLREHADSRSGRPSAPPVRRHRGGLPSLPEKPPEPLGRFLDHRHRRRREGDPDMVSEMTAETGAVDGCDPVLHEQIVDEVIPFVF